MKKRRFWMTVMVAFAILDLFLAGWISVSWLSGPRTVAEADATSETGTPEGAAVAVGAALANVALVQTPVPTEPRTAIAISTFPPFSRTPTATRTPTARSSVTPTRKPTISLLPTTAKTATVTRTTSGPLLTPAPAAPARTTTVPLPDSLNSDPVSVLIPPEPLVCTHANQVPPTLSQSIKLCPGEVYGTLNVNGEGVGIFGDDAKSAVIRSQGRGFGIILEGRRHFVRGVVIRASSDPADLNTLLCLYPLCRNEGRGTITEGGASYGGGILIHASDSTILDSDIQGGVSALTATNVRGLVVANNRLDKNTGWGSYNFMVNASLFVGNTVSDNNRSCIDSDGQVHPTGCESAGWVCINCQSNTIASNFCTNSGDCYYMNGEGQQGSNNNRFHANICRASPHNCFEVTFSVGNEFYGNSSTADRNTGKECLYPFWIGGSQVIFGRGNNWSCTISPDKALEHAQASTDAPTSIEYKQ